MDDGFDVYGDLEDFDLGEKVKEFQQEIGELKEKLQQALGKLESVEADKKKLDEVHNIVLKNYSSFAKTAKLEIDRKKAEIDRVRKEYDQMCFRRGGNSQRPNKVSTRNMCTETVWKIPIELSIEEANAMFSKNLQKPKLSECSKHVSDIEYVNGSRSSKVHEDNLRLTENPFSTRKIKDSQLSSRRANGEINKGTETDTLRSRQSDRGLRSNTDYKSTSTKTMRLFEIENRSSKAVGLTKSYSTDRKDDEKKSTNCDTHDKFDKFDKLSKRETGDPHKAKSGGEKEKPRRQSIDDHHGRHRDHSKRSDRLNERRHHRDRSNERRDKSRTRMDLRNKLKERNDNSLKRLRDENDVDEKYGSSCKRSRGDIYDNVSKSARNDEEDLMKSRTTDRKSAHRSKERDKGEGNTVVDDLHVEDRNDIKTDRNRVDKTVQGDKEVNEDVGVALKSEVIENGYTKLEPIVVASKESVSPESIEIGSMGDSNVNVIPRAASAATASGGDIILDEKLVNGFEEIEDKTLMDIATSQKKQHHTGFYKGDLKIVGEQLTNDKNEQSCTDEITDSASINEFQLKSSSEDLKATIDASQTSVTGILGETHSLNNALNLTQVQNVSNKTNVECIKDGLFNEKYDKICKNVDIPDGTATKVAKAMTNSIEETVKSPPLSTTFDDNVYLNLNDMNDTDKSIQSTVSENDDSLWLDVIKINSEKSNAAKNKSKPSPRKSTKRKSKDNILQKATVAQIPSKLRNTGDDLPKNKGNLVVLETSKSDKEPEIRSMLEITETCENTKVQPNISMENSRSISTLENVSEINVEVEIACAEVEVYSTDSPSIAANREELNPESGELSTEHADGKEIKTKPTDNLKPREQHKLVTESTKDFVGSDQKTTKSCEQVKPKEAREAPREKRSVQSAERKKELKTSDKKQSNSIAETEQGNRGENDTHLAKRIRTITDLQYMNMYMNGKITDKNVPIEKSNKIDKTVSIDSINKNVESSHLPETRMRHEKTKHSDAKKSSRDKSREKRRSDNTSNTPRNKNRDSTDVACDKTSKAKDKSGSISETKVLSSSKAEHPKPCNEKVTSSKRKCVTSSSFKHSLKTENEDNILSKMAVDEEKTGNSNLSDGTLKENKQKISHLDAREERDQQKSEIIDDKPVTIAPVIVNKSDVGVMHEQQAVLKTNSSILDAAPPIIKNTNSAVAPSDLKLDACKINPTSLQVSSFGGTQSNDQTEPQSLLSPEQLSVNCVSDASPKNADTSLASNTTANCQTTPTLQENSVAQADCHRASIVNISMSSSDYQIVTENDETTIYIKRKKRKKVKKTIT